MDGLQVSLRDGLAGAALLSRRDGDGRRRDFPKVSLDYTMVK